MSETGNLSEIVGEKKLEWKIKDFLLLSDKTNTRYESPQFDFSGASWKIWIYPNGQTWNASEGWISLYVKRLCADFPLTVDFSFSLKTVDRKVDLCKTYNSEVFEKEHSAWGCTEFILRSDLIKRKSELLPSDSLTVIYTLKNSEENDDTDHQLIHFNTTGNLVEKKSDVACAETSTQTEEEIGNVCDECSKFFQKKKVLDDLKELFFKQEDCDVIIRVQGKEFPVHRAILQARSPVLAATFRNDMKEKSTGIIDIEDCDPDTFSDLLCFLYYGEVTNLSAKNVFNLYSVADKYDVPDLRTMCVEFMKKKLSIDTFCKTISLALLHREAELIKLCTDFFTNNLQKIIVTVQWQSFLAEYPTESNELLIKALVPNKT